MISREIGKMWNPHNRGVFLEMALITICMASLNVMLNSLRMLAWLFNFLLNACSGGAAPSISSCCHKKNPITEMSIQRVFARSIITKHHRDGIADKVI